ncbi:MAG: Gfo/Idh/MocA family oxidoreductase [Alphaproteobacteria bacterium]|nr:Gfo/Idh/MocA family oxidoreductase [Alphaproteobacteria bacterium]
MFLRRRVPESGPLKAAVIGAGVFGHHHATKYKSLAQAGQHVELFAIADPNAEMLVKARAHHGCKVVADWRELLGKVDLVSICSPAVTHAEIVRDFLKAGTHVLVEKPIATTLEEASELVALSRQVDRVLSVGHQERFVFARTGLLDLPQAPIEISCWRQGPWTGRGDDVSVVLDLMIHDLDLVHALVPGAVTEVRAEGLIEYGPHADEVFALLRFAGGAIAKLETSRVANERKRGLRAVYADGVVEIDFLSRTVKNTTPHLLGALELGDPLGESVAGFVTAAQAGTDALVTPEQAAQALQTALWVERASGVALPQPARAAGGR